MLTDAGRSDPLEHSQDDASGREKPAPIRRARRRSLPTGS